MPIRLEDLSTASQRFSKVASTQITESYADNMGLPTVFLCHSHQDAEYVKGFITKLHEDGWRVYVDWLDHTMPAQPNRETAERIQARIRKLDRFLYLATPNSSQSRWCPWEIGYADGVKPDKDKILVCPTLDYQGHTYGAEYLQLYRRIDLATNGLGVWQPGRTEGVLLKFL